jgi:hypothetical protein
MSENQNFGFGKFVPGFDFLQNLAKGASQTLPQMPNLSNWVAPTLNVEELDKRIGELKAVHFWLDQNSKALGATIQALEVQKMTLATLKGMNFSMGEVANALQLKMADVMSAAQTSKQEASAGVSPGRETHDAASTKLAPAPAAAGKSKPARKAASESGGKPSPGVIDPLQWWGALTQQFQEIAAGAMKEAGAQSMAAGSASGSDSPAKSLARSSGKRAAKKAPR